MSKLSELHAILSEQAAELGFESLGEAEQAGYGVDWEKGKLISPEEAAHEAWLAERDILLRALAETERQAEDDGRADDACVIRNAIDFIKRGA